MPLLVAPVAFQRLVDPDGEVAMARAAAAAGTVDVPLDARDRAPGRGRRARRRQRRRWFQLYCFSDAGVTAALIDEAVDSGFEAIALTVDAPRAGRRERDFRTGFVVPPDVTAPASPRRSAPGGRSRPGGVRAGRPDPQLGRRSRRSPRECSLPVVLKGIQTGEDAALAVEHGAAGVIVSNHGGRQLDGVPATADILPEVVEAVAGRCEVLVDGGIRRGTDALIALALGAGAVLAGRAPLWGLAVGGEQGARRRARDPARGARAGMVLLGCSKPEEIGSEHVRGGPRLA